MGQGCARTLAPGGGSHPTSMEDLLRLALFVAGWLLLQRLIFPRLGVPS